MLFRIQMALGSISEAFIFGLTLFPVIPAQPFELCETAHHSVILKTLSKVKKKKKNY